MSPAQEAHLRLMSSLPVRTMAAKEYTQKIVNKTQVRGIVYRGRSFASISEALKVLRISPRTLYRMLASGEAQRLVE